MSGEGDGASLRRPNGDAMTLLTDPDHRHTKACWWDLFEARWVCTPVADDADPYQPQSAAQPIRTHPLRAVSPASATIAATSRQIAPTATAT
jgi:hypothetical protein